MTKDSAQRPSVVFVVPRYGPEVCGGAERHCRLVAQRMKRWWDIRIVTTCATDYLTWKNWYTPGNFEIDGISVSRFPTACQRDMDEFAEITKSVHPGVGFAQQEEWMKKQGPDCPELLNSLRELKEGTDLFVFFGYLYALTFFGLPLVSEKAVLVPMAHDEPPLRLSIFEELFSSTRYVLYNTPEEARLLRVRFQIERDRGEVVGVCCDGGEYIERAPNPHESRPYGIYIGRVDYPKGCGELFHYFAKLELWNELDLVIVGEAKFAIPGLPSLHYYGSIDEATKNALLADAAILFQPSPYESLSLSVMEAWQAGVPVLANAACDVLRGQCERSGGGWVYSGPDEFRNRLRTLLHRPALRTLMGLRGKRFVSRMYRWPRIEQCYLRLLA